VSGRKGYHNLWTRPVSPEVQARMPEETDTFMDLTPGVISRQMLGERLFGFWKDLAGLLRQIS